MANELTYQSVFTGQEMDERFTAVAQLQAALLEVETALSAKYVKPASGIPETDLDSAVQSALAKARSAVQDLSNYYTKTEIDSLLAAVNSQEYVDVATLPTASASTLGKIYLVGPTNNQYDRYYTSYDGSAYSWVAAGSTEINLSNYATKAELNQLDQKVTNQDASLAGVLAIANLVTTWEVGAIDATTGADKVEPSARRSNFIPVTPGKTYSYWGSTGSGTRAILSGYSSDSAASATTIVTGTAGQAGSIMREFTPASGTNYVRISYQIEYTGNYGFWDLNDQDNIINRENALEKEYKGYFTKNEILNRGIVGIYYDIPTAAAGHKLAILYLGVYPDNGKFYFGVQDLTENKQVGYAITAESYSPKPTTGIQDIFFPSLTGQQASYNITNVHVVVNWAFFTSAPFIFGDTSVIQLTDFAPHWTAHLQSSINMTGQKMLLPQSITLNNDLQITKILCMKGAKVYVPDSLSGGNWCLSMLGYSAQYGRFYFGLKEITSAKSFYIYKGYDSRPTSGRERLSGFLNQSFISTNGLGYFEIEIDWALVPDFFELNNNDVQFSVLPFSEINAVTIQEPFNAITGTFALPDGVKLVGKNSVPIVFGTNTLITVGSHCSIENLIFKYDGDGKITQREESGYIYTPVLSLSDLQAQLDATFYGNHGGNNRAIYIPATAEDVHIVGCQFYFFDYVAVYDGGDRHTSAEHSCIHDNMFINCRTGLWVSEEFSRIYGNYFYGCLTGMGLNMGDQNIFGNNFVRCDCGIFMNTNQTAHGQIVSCHFAHCGVSGMFAKRIGDGVGMLVSNCQFAQAPVIADYAVALRIDSCRLDTHFVISDGGKNSITNNNIRNVYATAAGVADIFDVPLDTIISGNRSLDLAVSDDNYNWLN